MIHQWRDRQSCCYRRFTSTDAKAVFREWQRDPSLMDDAVGILLRAPATALRDLGPEPLWRLVRLSLYKHPSSSTDDALKLLYRVSVDYHLPLDWLVALLPRVSVDGTAQVAIWGLIHRSLMVTTTGTGGIPKGALGELARPLFLEEIGLGDGTREDRDLMDHLVAVLLLDGSANIVLDEMADHPFVLGSVCRLVKRKQGVYEDVLASHLLLGEAVARLFQSSALSYECCIFHVFTAFDVLFERHRRLVDTVLGDVVSVGNLMSWILLHCDHEGIRKAGMVMMYHVLRSTQGPHFLLCDYFDATLTLLLWGCIRETSEVLFGLSMLHRLVRLGDVYRQLLQDRRVVDCLFHLVESRDPTVKAKAEQVLRQTVAFGA